MHEQSLMADLIRKILSISLMNGGGKVVSLKVKLGALAHISSEHFMEHFVEAAKNTVAENAHIDIDVETDIADPRAQDIWLESVELEEE